MKFLKRYTSVLFIPEALCISIWIWIVVDKGILNANSDITDLWCAIGSLNSWVGWSIYLFLMAVVLTCHIEVKRLSEY